MSIRLSWRSNKQPVIGDVRGRGLMLGVELVSDREKNTLAKAEALHVMDQMKGCYHLRDVIIKQMGLTDHYIIDVSGDHTSVGLTSLFGLLRLLLQVLVFC